ncbi:MAG: tail fiber domain-containing protein [Acidobacteria bacterium]|nr:tail fiber domain-containing protein [Acidobacteriota bacterium]
MHRSPLRSVLHLAALGILVALPAMAAPLVTPEAASQALLFRPETAGLALQLTVTGPEGFVFERSFTGDQTPALPTSGLADGMYRWELRADLSSSDADASGERRRRSRAELAGGRTPAVATGETRQQGTFRIVDGAPVLPGGAEGEDAAAATAGSLETVVGGLSHLADADQVILDDLAVLGSECIGTACSTSETFSGDDLRFREANIRVHFADSSSSPYPTNDWRITVNSSASGGQSYFSIDDADAGRTPFLIEAGAPTDGIYLDSSGRVGLGTSTPAEELSVKVGDSPGLRLEQDGSLSFTPQIWEIVANEANFLIEDTTHGSKYPFRIRPDAPTDSLHVAADGDVALGTSTIPGDVRLLVQANTSSNFGGIRVQNSGTGNIQTQFAGSGWEWRQTFRSGDLIFDSQEDGANELVLTTGGVLTVTSVVQTSDRNLKENVAAVDTGDILERLAAIPIERWNFTEDSADTPHLGPMAQDFYAAFGLGTDDRHIAATDADGVALAAIQALYQRLLAKEAAIDELRQRLEAHDRELAELLATARSTEP